MPRQHKATSRDGRSGSVSGQARRRTQIRKMNRLKDDVYREMLLLGVNRPGAEMGLALALLRAVVLSQSLPEPEDFSEWLKTTCPVGLRMIEITLGEGFMCDLKAGH